MIQVKLECSITTAFLGHQRRLQGMQRPEKMHSQVKRDGEDLEEEGTMCAKTLRLE